MNRTACSHVTFLRNICLFFLLSVASAVGQPLSASLQVNPFPTPYLSDWELNPNIAQLSLRNDSSESVSAQIFLVILRDGGGTVVSGSSSVFELPAGGDETILAPDLIDYQSVKYDASIRDIAVRTGRLPEGRYSLCVTIKDGSGSILVDETCAYFEIVYPDPPSLLYPFDADTIDNSYPVFQWQPVQAPVNYPIHYLITIAQLQDYQTPLQALTSTEYYQYQQDNLSSSNLSYPIDALPLEDGKKFVWQVRALDDNGYPPTANDGKSEIWTFTFRESGAPTETGDQSGIRIVPAGQEGGSQNVLSQLNGGDFDAVKAEWERIKAGGEVVIPLPGMGDFEGFSVSNVGVSFDTKNKVIAFRGKTERYNEPNAEVLLTLKWDKGLKCAISIKLPNFSFGGVFLELASYGRFQELATDFSVIVFANDKLTLSSKGLPSGVADFFDTLAVPVDAGMNYYGVINLSRTPWFETVVNFIGVESNQVVLTGHGGPIKNLLTKKAAKEFDLSLSAQFPAIIAPEYKLWLKSRQFELKGGVKRALAASEDSSAIKTTTDSTGKAKTDTALAAKYTPYLELKETLKGSFGNNKEHSFYRTVKLEKESTDSTGKIAFEFGTDDTIHLGLPWLNITDVKLAMEPDKEKPKVTLSGGVSIGDVKVSDSLFVEIGKADTTMKTDVSGSRKKDSTWRQADSVTVTATGSTKKFSFRAKAQLADKFNLIDLIKIARSTRAEKEQDSGPQIPEGFFNLSDVALGISGGDQNEFFFSGRTTLKQSQTDLLLSMTKDDKGERLVTVGVKPVDWKLTDAVPQLSNPVLDNINFSRVGFVITNKESDIESSDLGPDTYDFYEKLYGSDQYTLKLKPGINLVAVIPLDNMSPDDPLMKLMEHLGMQSGTILLQGTFGNAFGLLNGEGGANDLIKDIYLKASLPPMHPPGSPEWFKSGELALEITGEPSVGLVGTMTVQIQDDVLAFFLGGKIERQGAGVAVAMVGGLQAEEPWVAPFGIQFLTLNKVVLKISLNALGNLGLGFAGDLVVGEKQINTAIAVTVNAYSGVPTNFIFDGQSETGVEMTDIAKLQGKMVAAATGGQPPALPVENLPDMAIKNMHLKFAPKSDPDLGVEAGMAIKGDLNLSRRPGGEMENFAAVDCNVSTEGIWAKGHVNQFAVGPLIWQDGMVDLQIKLGDTHFLMSGEVDLLGSMKSVDLKLTRDSLSFASETEIDGLYSSQLTANGGFNLTEPSFKVHGELQSDFSGPLEEALAAGLSQFAAKGADVINASLVAYQEAEALREQKQAAVDKLKQRLGAVRLETKKGVDEVKAERDAEYARFQSARNAKDAAYRAYVNVPTYKVSEKASALVTYRSKLASYRIQAIANAKATADYAARLAAYNAIPDPDNNPALVALKGQADKLWAELEKQKENLERLQEVFQKINQYASAGQSPVKIQKAEFNATLDDLVQGKGVALHLEMKWLGEFKELNANVSLRDQREGIKNILEALIHG